MLTEVVLEGESLAASVAVYVRNCRERFRCAVAYVYQPLYVISFLRIFRFLFDYSLK